MTEPRRPMRIFPRNSTEWEKGYQQGVFDMIARQESRGRLQPSRQEPPKPVIAPPPPPRNGWQRFMDWLHAKLT